MDDVSDFYAYGGYSGQRAEQNSAQRVSKRCAVASLERFDNERADPLVFRLGY